MLFLLNLLLQASAEDQIMTVGILKRAMRDSGCQSAWFLSTNPDNPQRFCLNLATMPEELRDLVESLYDEEVSVDGHFEGGAVSLTRLSTELAPFNGARPALDYHLDPVTTTRSHNLGARLRENPTARIRIQPPATPIQIELIFQGVPMEADVVTLLEAVRFKSGSERLTPQALILGETLILTLPAPTPGQLLRIEPTEGNDLVAVFADGLFGGDRERLSLTLLLSPTSQDTP